MAAISPIDQPRDLFLVHLCECCKAVAIRSCINSKVFLVQLCIYGTVLGVYFLSAVTWKASHQDVVLIAVSVAPRHRQAVCQRPNHSLVSLRHPFKATPATRRRCIDLMYTGSNSVPASQQSNTECALRSSQEQASPLSICVARQQLCNDSRSGAQVPQPWAAPVRRAESAERNIHLAQQYADGSVDTQ